MCSERPKRWLISAASRGPSAPTSGTPAGAGSVTRPTWNAFRNCASIRPSDPRASARACLVRFGAALFGADLLEQDLRTHEALAADLAGDVQELKQARVTDAIAYDA